jgi:hypothetical protein
MRLTEVHEYNSTLIASFANSSLIVALKENGKKYVTAPRYDLKLKINILAFFLPSGGRVLLHFSCIFDGSPPSIGNLRLDLSREVLIEDKWHSVYGTRLRLDQDPTQAYQLLLDWGVLVDASLPN